MKLTECTPGREVTVTRGYSRRPAVVQGTAAGKVSVRFTDVPAGLRIPDGHAGNLYGASVVPGSVTPRTSAPVGPTCRMCCGPLTDNECPPCKEIAGGYPRAAVQAR